jgi:hypothetical protein
LTTSINSVSKDYFFSRLEEEKTAGMFSEDELRELMKVIASCSAESSESDSIVQKFSVYAKEWLANQN